MRCPGYWLLVMQSIRHLWETATETAKEALHSAADDAAGRKHGFVCTEHLLSAILKLPRSAAVLALQRSGRDIAQLTVEMEKSIPPGPIDTLSTIGGDYVPHRLPQTPRYKLAVELAFAAAAELHHERTTTGHLLLGLLRLPPEFIPPAIVNLAIDADELRRHMEDVTES